MSPKVFWRTTPRKLAALSGVHVRLNSVPSKGGNKKGHKSSKSSKGVGKPDTFIDQLF